MSVLDAAIERSTVVRLLDTLPDRVASAVEDSRLHALGDRLAGWVRASYCYRWLTAEPDPDVIVIDLRETYTVGPIVRLLEAVGTGLADGYANSRTEPVVATAAAALRARPIRTLGAVGLAVVPVSLLATILTGGHSTVLFVGHLLVAALSAAALRSTRSLADLVESRPIQLLVATVEPPEPPAETETASADVSEPAETTGNGESARD
ncbi:hypothetical protein [Natrinema salifodinae]|uniref:Uncharacterized protein n=1 Tax=Natrinema salifodinae TaxID=1202768 RepID=A0A1I0M0H0_9EURY|nr:hypothetical protein [Natrinema salifodinae]SEV81845.1 hypothetical protein SAMN05216285_0272 [Natrinema salifodinae]